MRQLAKPRRKNNALAAAAAQATNKLLGVSSSVDGPPATSSNAGPKPTEAFSLRPVEKPAKKRRQPGQHRRPAALAQITDFFTASRRRYAQADALPHSQHAHIPALTAVLASHNSANTMGNVAHAEPESSHGDLDALNDWDTQHERDDRTRHSRRRTAQNKTWGETVLPRLVEPVLRWRHGLEAALNDVQTCFCPTSTVLTVILASWDDLEVANVRICQCRPAAEQLLAVGFFPCAPVRPSMAFSVRLLEFISIHSLHVAPNATAFADTLVCFWAKLGKQIRNGDIRKRLATAVHWWQVLDNRIDAVMEERLQIARQSSVRLDSSSSMLPRDDNAATIPSCPATADPAQRPSKRPRLKEETPQEPSPPSLSPQAESRTRPSEHLQRACPLCFGGAKPELVLSSAHAIVCLDANFQQKRRKSKEQDPGLHFHGTHFLPSDELLAMERDVEMKRASRTTRAKRGKAARLPEDVLNECEESFKAAQEKVAKASRNYYADTGLMAMLCRHDRVLFVANMTSVGEKQYNALALISRLLSELPADWNVGMLYDIACQLSRSIDKHNLLGPSADRLSWAVSVFHAYGHQWACQVLFHPRKCDGFGRSDGEGCERFWSAIRRLIPVLRVTGFHRRLFILDRQITYQHEDGLHRLGAFVLRRYNQAQTTLKDALDTINRLELAEDNLAMEWEQQVESQLQKPQRQSKYAGDRKIEEILVELSQLDERKTALQRRRQEFRKTATQKTPEEVDAETRQVSMEQQALKSWGDRIRDTMCGLGESNRHRLDALKGDTYLRLRVNARALREKIRKHIIDHKFERSRLERHYRGQIQQNNDHEQAKDAVHRRERNLSDTIRRFNSIVQEMEVLIASGCAPRRVVKPRRLDLRRLFRLDVDDDIWQPDPGLGPQGEDDLPRWQTDEKIRQGITQMLEARRCREELERLRQESHAMCQWLEETAMTLHVAISAANADSVRAELTARLSQHSKLTAFWLRDIETSGLISIDKKTAVTNALDTWPATELSSPHKISHPLLAANTTTGISRYRNDPADSDDASSIHSSTGDFDDDFDSAVSDVKEEWDDEVGPPDGPQSLATGSTWHDPIAISSSDEESPPAGSRTRHIKPQELGRRCGRYTCIGEDVERVASRSRWLTGQSLAVFAESEYLRIESPDVAHLDSELFWHIRQYVIALRNGQLAIAARHRVIALEKVDPILKPPHARKWLITAHIDVPQHWTLVQVHWQEHTISFFDSFSMRNGYATEIQTLSFIFLQWCAEAVPGASYSGPWVWVDEQREVRQSNSYDCGPFVAADLASLLRSDSPSTKTEAEMRMWRREIAAQMRSLEPA